MEMQYVKTVNSVKFRELFFFFQSVSRTVLVQLFPSDVVYIHKRLEGTNRFYNLMCGSSASL